MRTQSRTPVNFRPAIGYAIAPFADLISGCLFGSAQEADFELEFEEAVVALARERAGGEGCEHRTPALVRMCAAGEVAVQGQCIELWKSLLGAFSGNPEVELSHARGVNDHAALGEENHLAPRGGMPAFGIIGTHFHGCLDVFAIEAVDQARLADTRGANENGRFAGLDEIGQLLHASAGEGTRREHQSVTGHASGVREPGVKVGAQIDFIEQGDWASAAFMCHGQHLLETGGVKARIRGGHQECRVDIRGENMLSASPADHLAAELGSSRKDGLNHGLLLAGHEFYGDPIPDLGQVCIGAACVVEALACDLREELRISRPDAEEMFILHRHASRNQTLRMVRRELLVEVSIPAQLRQVHSGVLIESFMACTAYARARLPRRPKLEQRIMPSRVAFAGLIGAAEH